MAHALLARRRSRGGHGSVAVIIEGVCALVALCALVAGLAAVLVLVAVRLVRSLVG